MRLLYKNQLRTLIKNPMYPLILGFVFMLTITAYVSITQLTTRLKEPVEPFLTEQNVEDFHLTFGQIRFEHLTGAQRLQVCQTLNIMECVGLDEEDPIQMNHINTIIAERIMVRPYLYETLYDPIMLPLVENYDISLERNIGLNLEEGESIYRFITINEVINIPLVTSGRLPDAFNEIAVYEDFLKANNLSLNDTITIAGKSLTIVGTFYAPDYTFPALKANAINYDAKTQSLILTNESTLFSFQRPVTVKYQGKGNIALLSEDFNVTDIYTSQFAYLGRNTQMIQTIMPRDYNARIDGVFLETLISNTFSNVFIGTFIVLSMLLSFFFLAYYIEANKQSILILKQLGYSNRQLIFSLNTFSLFLIGIILFSYGLGLLSAYLMYPIYSARYQFPDASFSINHDVFLIGFMMPIILVYGLNTLFNGFALKTLDRPNVLTPLKLTLTRYRNGLFKGLLFFIISTLLLFSLFTATMVETFKTTTTKGNDYAYNVVLAQLDNTTRSEIEPYTLVNGEITFINGRFLYEPLNLQVYGIDQESTLKTLYTSGKAINTGVLTNGVILSKHASITHDLDVLDSVTLKVGGLNQTFTVLAISDELIESALYIDQHTLNSMLGVSDDYYNAYYTMERPSDSDRSILRIIEYDRVVLEIETLFNLSNQLTEILMIFATLIALTMFYFLIHKEFNDKRSEHAMLKALGYDALRLYMRHMLKNYVFISFSFILGFLLVGSLLNLLTQYLYDSLGFLFIFNRTLFIPVLSFIFVLSLAFFSTIMIFIKFNKLPISHYLKS